MVLKSDAKDIRDHMSGLAVALSLEDSRKWWPNWLFRSDHVENAAAILNSGKLLSRAAAEKESLIIKDSGSPQHIGELGVGHRRYVRLYFRPRTPTQYANEGIRPTKMIEYQAHMPVPVYFLFSSDLLMEEGVRFSRGRLTPGAPVGSSATFLKGMEFGDIFHDGSVGRLGASTRRSEILNARHSEALITDELSLDLLKHIVCRSAPERDTLLNLLKPAVRTAWSKRIHVDEGRRLLFQKRGTFVQDVDLLTDEAHFVFYSNIESRMRGPFDLYIEWSHGGRREFYQNSDYVVSTNPLRVRYVQPSSGYKVIVTLNGDTAYIGEYDEVAASHNLY